MKSVCLETGAMSKQREISSSQSSDEEKKNDQKLENIKCYPLSFQDLVQLVKNLELEININTGNLI